VERVLAFVDESMQWSYARLETADTARFTETTAARFLLFGGRIRPLAMMQPESQHLQGAFVECNVGRTRVGAMDLIALDAHVGFAFRVTDWLALGPAVHAEQNLRSQGNDVTLVGNYLALGLNLSMGPRRP
jgi:hypothetical protein